MNIPSAYQAVLLSAGYRVAACLLIILVALVVRNIVRRAVRAAVNTAVGTGDEAGRAARLKTLGGLATSAASYAILFLAALMVLDQLGVDTRAVLTTAGVLGVAVGLGSQKLVRDVIGGFFILLENQFSVSEVVTLGGAGVTGTVQEMGLRVTKLRDGDGRLVMAGNGDITVVTNHSRGPLVINVDVVLAEDADMAVVNDAVTVAAGTLEAEDWADAPKALGLVEPPEGKIKVRVSGRAQPGRRDAAEMALRGALPDAMSAKELAG